MLKDQTMEMRTRQFIDLLLQSQLLDTDAVRNALGAIQTNHGGVLPTEAKIIASELVDGGVITEWQARNLLKGKAKGFFLGKYKLIRQLGAGGMSVVYLGEHTVMRKRYAIKVLPRKLKDGEKSLSRFQQEARACAMLEHPNIVQVTDFDTVNGRHIMVMEFVDGTDLQRLVRNQGALPIPNVVQFLYSAAAALQHAHERGIIHRDIKPLNMLINRECVLKVTDFGLARLFYNADPNIVENAKSVLGTADYLAPEQALDSGKADGRSDLYSLGCTLYFMLTGKAPFAEGTLKERIARHRTKPAPDPRLTRKDCPAELASICLRLLAKSPDERYQTASQLLQAIKRTAGVTTAAQMHVPVNSSISAESFNRSNDGDGSSFEADTSIVDGATDNTFTGSDSGIEALGPADDPFADLPAPGGSQNTSAGPSSFQQTATPASSLAQPSGSFSAQNGQQFSSSANSKVGSRTKPKDKSQNLVIYAGIGMAIFSVIFSIAMAVIFLNDNSSSKNLIKDSESGGGQIIIVPK